ncbi:MAG TPA: OmpH family outer membrane protein [Candidatus Baltobacteraceae bacterium]|nr:OmpH family outer membrane protein [Candidatus Baltobacteraceae bacterium]
MRSSRAAAAFLAALALAACAHAPKPDDPNVRGIGYVRIEDVIKVHPLYPQLSQLQDSIDALNLKALGASAVPRTAAQIAQETKELNSELKAAQDRANAILRQKQTDYEQREQAAIRAALAAAGQGTNGNAPVSAMQNVTAQQAQQVTAQANADFAAYQKSVIAQDNAAVRKISEQLSARADAAYRQKATQLQEKESQLSLELSQQDASKRLDLRMKLGNLALSDAQRKQYRDELAALDANESAVVQAQRKRDQQELAAYQKQLRDQTSKQIAAQVSAIHSETTAKLQSRRNEVSQQVSSQLQGLRPAAVPSNLPAATRDKLAQIDKQFKSQFKADAQKTIDQYQATKADLDAQYAALQGADGAATGAANKQVSDLQHQRDDLYNKMVEQVKRDAGTVAAKRGLQVVFISVVAAPGGIDLTNDVEKDIESLHQ